MSRFFGGCILFLYGAAVAGVFAQTPKPVLMSQTDEEVRRRSGRSGQLREHDRGTNIVFAKRGTLPFKKRISRDQKKILAPDAADLNLYANFLQNQNAGLIKLFPDLGCEDNARVVRVDEVCLNQVPMSSFYSFREREHTTEYLSDIRLKNDVLITDGLLTQGILVALGDAPLENITLNSEGIKYLNEYQPEVNSRAALEQTRQLIKGVDANGYFYRKALPAQENTTYALRIVAYRGKVIQRGYGGFPFDMLDGDERVDLTIAFRLLKKDAATGHYNLLWKELAEQDAPKILFPKAKRKQNNQRTK